MDSHFMQFPRGEKPLTKQNLFFSVVANVLNVNKYCHYKNKRHNDDGNDNQVIEILILLSKFAILKSSDFRMLGQ